MVISRGQAQPKNTERARPTRQQTGSEVTPERRATDPAATLKRAASPSPPPIKPAEILVLQRAVGNQAVQRVVDGDITRMGITAEWARALDLLELPEQIAIATQHLEQLQTQANPDPAVIAQAEQNLLILQEEQDRRIEEEAANLAAEMGEYGSRETRGWHVSFPRATQGRLGTQVVEGEGRRSMALTYPQRPRGLRGGPGDAFQWAANRQFLEQLRRRLEAVQIPTASGHLRVYRDPQGRGEGYVFGAEDIDIGSGPAAQEREGYQDFWQRARAARTADDIRALGINVEGDRDQFLWRYFQFIFGEGDPAAINAWDAQVLTIGSGFSASERAGYQAGQIYGRMPPAFHANLYRHGILVNADRTFTVLDPERGVVETGQNALRVLQANERMLGVLIQGAMSGEEMAQSSGGAGLQGRQWMLRAQFEQFRALNREMRYDSVRDWPVASLKFAFLLRHWMGGLRWSDMGADPSVSAQNAYRRVGSWDRIRGIAARAGVPQNQLGPEPEAPGTAGEQAGSPE